MNEVFRELFEDCLHFRIQLDLLNTTVYLEFMRQSHSTYLINWMLRCRSWHLCIVSVRTPRPRYWW